MKQRLAARVFLGSAFALSAVFGLATEASGQIQRADLSLVGQSNLAVPGTDGSGPTKPRGNNDDVAIVGNTAFVGGGSNNHGARSTVGRVCTDWGGIKNVDLSNPSNPVLRAPIRIDDPSGIGAPVGNPRQTESLQPPGGQGRRFHNIAQSANALDAISVDIPGFKGDLLAVSVARCENSFFAGGRFEFYNVTNPASPQKIGTFDSPGTPGTFEDIQVFQRDNKVFGLGTIAFGSSQGPGGEFRYLDVTPALSGGAVTQLGEYPTPPTDPGQISTAGCYTFYGGRSVAPTPDGQNAIMSWYDGLIEYGGARSAAVLNFNLSSLPMGFATPPPFFGYPIADRTVEGNAADVQPFTGPGGKLLVMLSEDDTDPSLTNLAVNAVGSTSNHRVCESRMSQRLYQLPNQQLAGPVAYLGRGCPGSKLTGTPDKADDAYLDDPSGKIALLDAGGNNFGGCSEFERVQRAIDAGATAVMITLGDEQLNPSNNGPTGGIPSKPVLRTPPSAYRRMQYVPSPVLTATTFPDTFDRSTASNVTVQRFCTAPANPGGPVSCPMGTRADLERTDISRFRSVANATDRLARGVLQTGNPAASSQCSPSTCRFEVVAGTSYRAGASLEVASRTDGAFRAAVTWYDAGGAQISESEIQSLSAVTPRTRYQQTVTAPAGAVRGAVKFEWTGADAAGTAFADALSFVPSTVSATLKDNPGEWGAQRVLDFSQSPPVEIGSYRSPSSRSFPPPPGPGAADDAPGFYAPRLARMFGDDVMLTTWTSDGLRVLDVSDPTAPREIGSFVPPAVADPSAAAGAGFTTAPPRTDSASLELRRGRSWPTRPLVTGVDVLKREGSTGTVVISDINGGIYVLNLAVVRPGQGPVTPQTPRPVTPTADRVRPNMVRPGVSARQRGNRIVVRVNGRMTGVRSRPCGGRVKIGVRSANRRRAQRTVRMSARCRYQATLTYPVKRLPRRLRPRRRVLIAGVTARFQGNSGLTSDLSPTRRARVKR